MLSFVNPTNYPTKLAKCQTSLYLLTFALLLGCMPLSVSAQYSKAKIDSLHQVLKTAKEDTNKVLILKGLSVQYRISNPKLQKKYVDQTLALAKKIKFPKGEGMAYNDLGSYYYRRGEYAQALAYATQALQIGEELKDLDLIRTAVGTMALVYSVGLGQINSSIAYYEKNLEISEKQKNKAAIATSLNNIASIYAELGQNIPLAHRYADRAIRVAKELGNDYNLIIYLDTKAEIYEQQGRLDSAIFYFQKSQEIAFKVGDDKESLAYNCYHLGNIYTKQGDYARALKEFEQALSYAKEAMTPNILKNCYQSFANFYDTQKQYDKAYPYLKEYIALKDSLLSSEVLQKTASIQLDYEKQFQAKLLANEKQLAKERQRNYFISFLGGLGTLLAILLLILRNNRQKNKANKKLQEKNKAISQQSEELQQLAEELATQRDNLEKANENIILLSEIGKEITSTLHVKEIIEIAYEKVNTLMDANVFLIGIFNEAKQQIEIPTVIEKGETHPYLVYHLSEAERPAVLCFSQRKELIWNDVYADYPKVFDGKTLPPVKSGEQTNSIIYLPLISKGKAIGVISAQSFQKNAYSDYHVHMLRNIAMYTTIAVENAENLHALDEEKKNLESINQELEALTEELRQQTDTVQAQRDQLSASSTQLEELLEETRSQKELVEIRNQEMEALQSTKDLMISAVNHDLRNPLNPILNYSHANYPDPDKNKRLEMIHERAKTMFSLINDIMDVYRADKLSLQPQTANLHQAVEEAIKAISEAKSDLPEIINEVPLDTFALFEYKYIERVLENFLSNAVKYSETQEKGGKVRFHTQIIPGENARNNLKISVTDNGVGIPKDKFEEIFLPFTNPNAKDIGAAKSVGIGLTFCKTIVEAHNSQILIDSEVGLGTTFSFHLPLIQKETKSTETQSITLNRQDIRLREAQKTALADVIAALQQYELYEIELQDAIDGIFTNDDAQLEAWKNALQQAKDEDDEERFKELLS